MTRTEKYLAGAIKVLEARATLRLVEEDFEKMVEGAPRGSVPASVRDLADETPVRKKRRLVKKAKRGERRDAMRIILSKGKGSMTPDEMMKGLEKFGLMVPRNRVSLDLYAMRSQGEVALVSPGLFKPTKDLVQPQNGVH